MKILAIESSCDETSAAVISSSSDNKILSNIVFSQIDLHKKYGGVVPEYAARNHLEVIDQVIIDALKKAKLMIQDVDIIAATAGPGLIGGLLVGLIISKTIAMMLKKPFMAINHLEAHILTPRLECNDLDFPYLALLASGGNFLFAEVKGVGQYKILGETLDDAAGEAFDKIAKMIGLSYPGGPSIEKTAIKGNKERFKYTMPLLRKSGCNTSFSGLKTATKKHIEKIGKELSMEEVCDIAASFQNIVVNFIVRQFKKAVSMASFSVERICLVGGVASNSALRQSMMELSNSMNLRLYTPHPNLCSDNAAMVGWCALERVNAGYNYSDLDFPVKPRWALKEV